jgi:hypothetical protein
MLVNKSFLRLFIFCVFNCFAFYSITRGKISYNLLFDQEKNALFFAIFKK